MFGEAIVRFGRHRREAPVLSFLRGPGRFMSSGGNSEGETPLPIPNREVKPLSADGTWWATTWESRSLPVNCLRAAALAALFQCPTQRQGCSGTATEPVRRRVR